MLANHEEVIEERIEKIKKADKITRRNFNEVTLERAIFLSWYCSYGDCKFCFMSTQKDSISDPKRGRRTYSSIFAEAILLKKLDWNLEFLSSGRDAFETEELVKISKGMEEIFNEKIWLNVGLLSKEELETFDSIKGVVGAIETVNPELRKKVCPSKAHENIEGMLNDALDIGLKTGVTIILGIGEKRSDTELLLDFIEEYDISRVVLYPLNPQEKTVFEDYPGPPTFYLCDTISTLRITYPDLEIIAGTWIENISSICLLLLSGANGLTKFPFLKMFGTRYGKRLEKEVSSVNRKLKGSFTDLERIKNLSYDLESFSFSELVPAIKQKIESYKAGVMKRQSKYRDYDIWQSA